jgi:hypothetical protein
MFLEGREFRLWQLMSRCVAFESFVRNMVVHQGC